MGVSDGAGAYLGWSPTDLALDCEPPVATWCFTEGVQFSDPFFADTIRRCLGDPFRLLFWRESDLGPLLALAEQGPVVEPAGLIFHTSRAGSTLISQMLASLPTTLVLSEPGPVDTAVRAKEGDRLSAESHVQLLRGVVAALANGRAGPGTRLILKLDAWTIFDLALLERAFPRTPRIFVYRDPVEVLVSQMQRRGYHMIPGTLPLESFGLSDLALASLTQEDFCATVLARLCETAREAARRKSIRLVHYDQLPVAVEELVAPLFGIEVGPRERELFAEVAKRNAKNSAVPFVADSAERRRLASPEILVAARDRVSAVYQDLETLRTETS
jgi:hypothetical protein